MIAQVIRTLSAESISMENESCLRSALDSCIELSIGGSSKERKWLFLRQQFGHCYWVHDTSARSKGPSKLSQDSERQIRDTFMQIDLLLRWQQRRRRRTEVESKDFLLALAAHIRKHQFTSIRSDLCGSNLSLWAVEAKQKTLIAALGASPGESLLKVSCKGLCRRGKDLRLRQRQCRKRSWKESFLVADCRLNTMECIALQMQHCTVSMDMDSRRWQSRTTSLADDKVVLLRRRQLWEPLYLCLVTDWRMGKRAQV